MHLKYSRLVYSQQSRVKINCTFSVSIAFNIVHEWWCIIVEGVN